MFQQKTIKICYSSYFARAFKKLPKQQQNLAIQKQSIFKKNIFDARLKTHKLHGRLKNQWSFSISRKYRIMFMFVKPDEILFLDIGDHGIYQ